MTNKDLQLLEEIVNTDIPNLIPKFMNEAFNNGTREIEHPLDCTVTEKLKEISSKMRISGCAQGSFNFLWHGLHSLQLPVDIYFSSSSLQALKTLSIRLFKIELAALIFK